MPSRLYPLDFLYKRHPLPIPNAKSQDANNILTCIHSSHKAHPKKILDKRAFKGTCYPNQTPNRTTLPFAPTISETAVPTPSLTNVLHHRIQSAPTIPPSSLVPNSTPLFSIQDRAIKQGAHDLSALPLVPRDKWEIRTMRPPQHD
jgi:hypothetical protein